ncbi:MAG: hypothetical protein JNM62_04530 [Flavobacteriales bacterium]|nr:hypothetical protein [Flavobacteriales bacterium]
MRLSALTGALALTLSLSGPLHAQSKTDRASVEWGAEMSDKKDGVFGSVFGHTDDAVYMTVFMKKERFVRKMDTGHRVQYQKLLPMEIGKNDHVLERIVLSGDKIIVFSSFFDKKEKQNSLYGRTFNASDMSPAGEMQKLSSFSVERNRNQGSFSVHASPNDEVFLVYQSLPYEKEGHERFELKVLDNDLKTTWEQRVDLPYRDDEFGVQSFRVDNDASVMMIGNKYAEKREAKALRKDGKATYTYHLLVYRGDGAEPDDHAVEVPDKFLQDLTITLADEGDILCGGFYGAKGSFTTSGAFFLRLDRNSKEIVHSSFKEFDKDFITMYMTEKEEAKATKRAEKKGEEVEMYDYELREIVVRSDGGAILLGEQYRFYTVTTCSSTPNGGQSCSTSYHYVYNDIIAINIDPQGNIEWAAKVPKRQHTVNDGGRASSYALVVKGTDMHILFNDNGKNLFLKPGDKVEAYRPGKEALITLATIDQDGKVTREALLAVEKREAITLPMSAVQIGDDRLFIFADWRKTHRFGTVTFN